MGAIGNVGGGGPEKMVGQAIGTLTEILTKPLEKLKNGGGGKGGDPMSMLSGAGDQMKGGIGG